MKKPVYLVRSRADLDALGPYSRAGRRLRFREIRLDLPQLPDADLAARSARLNRAYFASGSGEAALAGIVSLVPLAIVFTLRSGEWQARGWINLAYALLAFFLGTGVGKWIGLQRAHVALSRELAELRQSLKRAPGERSPLRPVGGLPVFRTHGPFTDNDASSSRVPIATVRRPSLQQARRCRTRSSPER